MYSPDSTSSPHRTIPPITTSSLTLALLIVFLSITMASATPLPMHADPNANANSAPPSERQDTKWSIVFDLGSGGSRIHVDAFNGLSHPASYFAEVKPGLSDYRNNLPGIPKYLEEIMKLAIHVPEAMRHSCPVAIRATGGLRLLKDQGARDKLLEAVKESFEKMHPDFMRELVTVGVIGGEHEALFGWRSANYLLGTLGGENPTVALAEMGGASAQLVFESTDSKAGKDQIEYTFKFGKEEKKYVLYQHSYLGYGYREARRSLNIWVMQSEPNSGQHQLVTHPCLPPETFGDFSFKYNEQTISLPVKGPTKKSGMNSFNTCSALIKKVLFSQSSPTLDDGPRNEPFASVKLPSIYERFLNHGATHGAKRIALISSFYDEIRPFFPPSNPSSQDTISFKLVDLMKHAHSVCNGDFKSYERAFADKLEKDLTQCMDLTYFSEPLQSYGIPTDQDLEIAEYIVRGEVRTKMQWAIGAALHLASGQELQ